MNLIWNNPQWAVPAAVVLLGLVVYGFRDLIKFSIKRVWAISGVCFDESIRRRVLWITPLAIVGVILVTQFQRPSDEQDAIRQTTKFALFACGMVVTITAIILACTNLPKEIETRVIYTIVTKPTTRLEIIVGKVIGFAKVSLTILLIMGLFTFGYLHLQAWRLRKNITQRLAAGAVDPLSRATYEYWAQEGLLGSRTFARPANMEIFARQPADGDDKRWFFGMGEGSFAVPFLATQEQLTPGGVADAKAGSGPLYVRVQVGFGASEYGAPKKAPTSALPMGVAAPASQPINQPTQAAVSVNILDQNFDAIVNPQQINNGQPLMLSDPSGEKPLLVPITPQQVAQIALVPAFYVQVTGLSAGVEYFANVRSDPNPFNDPVSLIVPGVTEQDVKVIGPLADPRVSGAYRPLPPVFRSRNGTYGQELRGGDASISPIAVLRFRGAPPLSGDEAVGFELHAGIERSGDESEDQADATQLQIIAQDKKSGLMTDPLYVYPESNLTCYFKLPASVLRSGDFDLYIRNLTNEHYVGFQSGSLQMIASQESFNLNLIKSLSILWMLSILVVIVGIFCSTFLSWPIAVVLTLVILLGHWGVSQLSDDLMPGIGNQVATDFFGASSSASQAKVVSASVEALSKMLLRLSSVLPDINQFSAIERIQDGITISGEELSGGLIVLVMFGLPMIVLSYIFLRNKEVAP